MLVEHRVHWTAFVITVLCIVVAIEQPGILSSPIAPLPTLGIGMAFLWLAGQRYQHRLHSYTLLGIGVVGALLCYIWALPFYSPQQFVTLQRLQGDHGLGLLFVLLSLSLWAIAWGLTRQVSDTEEFQADFDRSAALSGERWDHNSHYHPFLLQHLPPRCESVLDVGCGTGAFARVLASEI